MYWYYYGSWLRTFLKFMKFLTTIIMIMQKHANFFKGIVQVNTTTASWSFNRPPLGGAASSILAVCRTMCCMKPCEVDVSFVIRKSFFVKARYVNVKVFLYFRLFRKCPTSCMYHTLCNTCFLFLKATCLIALWPCDTMLFFILVLMLLKNFIIFIY